MHKCPVCKDRFSTERDFERHFKSRHPSEYAKLKEEHNDSSGSFLLSAAIGAATDSWLLGGLIGGDIAGGIVGDILGGSDD